MRRRNTDEEPAISNDPATTEEVDEASDDEVPLRAPWHFKVLLVGTIGYLIYRLIWFIQWLGHH